MTEIVLLNFDGNRVRVIMDHGGNPWLVAADVCAVLGIRDVSDAVSRVAEADRRLTPIRSGGQNRQMLTVNESGLYDLVLDSRKPEARRFRRWIISEVLPSLRRSGSYSMVPKSFSEALELAAQQQREIEAAQRTIAELEPAAEQFYRWQFSEDTVYVVEWAKSIGLTQAEAFEALRTCGVLFKQQHEDPKYTRAAFNVPKRGYEHYFVLIDEWLPGPRCWAKVPKITAEGQVVLAELLVEHGWLNP